MKGFFGVIVTGILFCFPKPANAQAHLPRVELGSHFTSLELPQPINEHALGIGGRFGYNFSNHLGVEAEVNHFPGGRTQAPDFGETQALFGAKVGYGRENWGIFAKVRPGLIHFSDHSTTVSRGLRQQDYLSVDLGIVVERYFQNHVYLRFDGGDTLIRYGGERYLGSAGVINTLSTTHNFQVTFAVGFHF